MLQDVSKELALLDNNDITVETLSSIIQKTELTTPTKWKSSSIENNQVVLFFDKYVYKVYIEREECEFNSIIRHKLAEIYQEEGIEWYIKSFRQNNLIIDIEKREKLDVINDDNFYSNLNYYYIPYSVLVRKLEEKLNLDRVLQKIKFYLPEAHYIKLVRDCIPKSIDYAYYNYKIILLDDADWVLTIFDKDKNILGGIEDLTISFPDLYDNKDYTFSKLYHNTLKVEKISAPSNYFYLYKDVSDSKELSVLNQAKELKLSRDTMIRTSAEVLLAEDERFYMDSKTITVKNEEDDLLYTNNTGRKSFQWELWPTCNSQCKFCYLGEENKVIHPDRQLKSLLDFEKAIDNLDFTKYNNISIIGGEFFQGQLSTVEVREKFFSIMRKVFTLYRDKKIGSIWITATLTIGDQKDLHELLGIAESLGVLPKEEYGASGLWICTSWDSKGRFHTDAMQKNWEHNMERIHQNFPWVKFNTTIILTQDFIEKYLSDEFKPKEFMKKFNTTIFYKQCGIPSSTLEESEQTYAEVYGRHCAKDQEVPRKYLKEKFQKKIGFDFFPKRETFLSFLTKYYTEDPDTFERLFNILFRADDLHRNFNDENSDLLIERRKDFHKAEADGVATQKCGHIYDYAPYIDSDKCCICDRELVTGRDL